MRKRIALLLAVSVLGVGATSPYALAQDTDSTTSEEDEGTDYGWIGLLGLAGLAGLAGRKRDDHHVTTTTDRDATRRQP
jgi:MYXO-CTERM domain-containing protein